MAGKIVIPEPDKNNSDSEVLVIGSISLGLDKYSKVDGLYFLSSVSKREKNNVAEVKPK